MGKKDPRKRYTGVLAEPLEPVPFSIWMTDEDRNERFKKRSADEIQKMYALLNHHSIDINSPDPWFWLAFALAKESVPGFQDRVKKGAPKKWGVIQLALLRVEIDALVEESGTTVEGAAKRLAITDPWAGFISEKYMGQNTHPDPAEVLRHNYFQVSDHQCKIFKMGRMLYVSDGDMTEWDKLVVSCLAGTK